MLVFASRKLEAGRIMKVGQRTDICDLVRIFYEIAAEFSEEYGCFIEKGCFNFDKIDRQEIKLFYLKNACHAAFRNSDRVKNNDLVEGNLFDLTIGSIFHETLHLKEYIYTLQSYAPRYVSFEQKARFVDVPNYQLDFLRYSQQIVNEAKKELPKKAKEIVKLFQNATSQIELIISRYKNDIRLIRMLYCEQDLLKKIYREQGITKLYNLMYEGKALEGYYQAGASFLKSGFYDEAVRAFSKAIGLAKSLNKKQQRYLYKREILRQIKKNCQQVKVNLLRRGEADEVIKRVDRLLAGK